MVTDHYGGGGPSGNNNTALGGHGGGGDASLTPGTTVHLHQESINLVVAVVVNGPNRIVDAPGGSGVLMIRYAHSEPVPSIQGGITYRRTKEMDTKYHTFTAPTHSYFLKTKDLTKFLLSVLVVVGVMVVVPLEAVAAVVKLYTDHRFHNLQDLIQL